MAVVYMNLQLPRCTANVSPHCWWALTPPSHLYNDNDNNLADS